MIVYNQQSNPYAVFIQQNLPVAHLHRLYILGYLLANRKFKHEAVQPIHLLVGQSTPVLLHQAPAKR